ncbi:MAG TPA: hypothetical protein PLO61_01890 [Fimbriimonadaceae bacterium]|nr:hypothetical protein [Fimbriimonadaceae bacterium]HRJ32278.1 hypothetical protein [Fimbriimonadaceae bacterium]
MSRPKRLKDVWPFSKPKTPGFGIHAEFYLSILASRARLPSVPEVIHPRGEGGAMVGFGVPLASSATKNDLTRPLERGVYAFSSKDQKTVLKARVVPRDEAGFDPEPFLRSPLGQAAPPELGLRMRATWSLIQLTFESHDPMVYPALDFMLDLAVRLSGLTDGVVADPISQRYLLPEQVRFPARATPVDAREWVALHSAPREGAWTLYTLGLRKFAQPELEFTSVPEESVQEAGAFLLGLSQSVLEGGLLRVDTRVGSSKAPFQVCAGGLDRRLWDGIPCFELVPDRGRSLFDCFSAWRQESSNL